MGWGTPSGDERWCDGPGARGAQGRQRAMQIRNPECLVLPEHLLLLVEFTIPFSIQRPVFSGRTSENTPLPRTPVNGEAGRPNARSLVLQSASSTRSAIPSVSSCSSFSRFHSPSLYAWLLTQNTIASWSGNLARTPRDHPFPPS